MDAKEFLELGRGATMLINAKQDWKNTLLQQIDEMEALAGYVPKYPTRERPIYEALRLAHGMLADTDKAIEDLRLQQTDIINAIEVIPDSLCRELLTRRFIRAEDWPQIADEMFFSLRYMFRLQKKALEMIEVPESYQNM